MEKRVQRNINVELLRNIAMLMIVGLHVLRRGGLLEEQPFSNLWYLTWMINGICYVGVNVYVLISGYFLCTSKFSIKKFLKLWMTIYVYSVGLAILVTCITGEVDLKKWFYALLPVIGREYWFMTTYLGMYLLSPFLNILINSLDRRKHTQLIVVLILVFSVIDNLVFFSDWINFGGGYSLPWFIVLYFVGSWIRKYYEPKISVYKHMCAYIVVTVLIPLSKFIPAYLSNLIVGQVMFDELEFAYNSILVTVSSILIFTLFIRRKPSQSISRLGRSILLFGKSTGAVYLIHSNPFVVDWIWSYSPLNNLSSCKYIVVWVLCEILVVFFTCAVIDILLRKICRPLAPIGNRVMERVERKLKCLVG